MKIPETSVVSSTTRIYFQIIDQSKKFSVLDEGVHRKKVFGARCKKPGDASLLSGFFPFKGWSLKTHPPILVKRWKIKLLFHGRLGWNEEIVNLKLKKTTKPKKRKLMIFNEFIAEIKSRKFRADFQNFYWYEKRV